MTTTATAPLCAANDQTPPILTFSFGEVEIMLAGFTKWHMLARFRWKPDWKDGERVGTRQVLVGQLDRQNFAACLEDPVNTGRIGSPIQMDPTHGYLLYVGGYGTRGLSYQMVIARYRHGARTGQTIMDVMLSADEFTALRDAALKLAGATE